MKKPFTTQRTSAGRSTALAPPRVSCSIPSLLPLFAPMISRIALLVILCLCASTRADDWPQWLGPKRDGVWRETGILEKFPAGGPKGLWRAPLGGGYAGPAVASGRVYVHDRQLPQGVKNPANQFGRDKVPGTERIL